MVWRKLAISVCLSAAASAQQPGLEQILQQLNQLQQENQKLNQQIDVLRKQVLDLQSSANVPVAEKVDIVAQRVEDLATSKVDAAQRFPLQISGLVLMNTYLYSGHTGGAELPMASVVGPSQQSAGGTFRNTELAFLYTGPKTVWGAQVTGRLQLDLFGGSLNTQNNLARIRTSDVSLNWATRSLTFAVDKPILSPRDPDSLSQLGIPLLANSGNLWLWQPQLRYEERWQFTESSGLRARLGIYQTNETLSSVPVNTKLSASRPALQGRFEFFHDTKDGRRFEIAPGFHTSRSHVAGAGVTSYAASVDWLVPLAPHLDWTGFAFTGQDLAGLGIAAVRQSFSFRPGGVFAVRSRGGWTQTTFHATSRLDLNLLAGMQDDFNRDLSANGIARNLSYGTNLRFHLAPNLLLGPEIMQIRTTYRQSGILLINRYDLALGYLF
jgi:hypothetical protein